MSTSIETPLNPLHPTVEPLLDPKVIEIYNKYQVNRLRADQVTIEQYHADPPRYTFPRAHVGAAPRTVKKTTLYKVLVTTPPGEIEVEVYYPTDDKVAAVQSDTTAPLPAYINFHGGGFVLGGLEDDVPMNKHIAQNSPCIVVNVAYRMSPEYPHPTPVLDCWDSLVWVHAKAAELGVDPARIAVGGLSAGGCLAAALAQKMRTQKELPPLVLQLLVVPVLDARYIPMKSPETVEEAMALDTPYESYKTLAFAPMLPLHRLVWFYNHWLGNDPKEHAANAADILASPLAVSSDDEFVGIAPASIHAASVDPLVSEAEVYHEKLTKVGVPSELFIYKGMVHPFVQWEGELPQAREMLANFAIALNKAFYKK